MTYDVFISHSVKDQEISDCIYSHLKAEGIKCFMDSRNLIPGTSYPSQLANAILRSRAVILIFSSNSDVSLPVQNEVGLARNNKIPIIPVRIENVLPHELALFITTSQWLDVFPLNVEKNLPKLIKAINAIKGTEEEEGENTVIKDYYWHDITKDEIKPWLENKIKLLNAGKIIIGRTFLYRRNENTGQYQRKLKDKH